VLAACSSAEAQKWDASELLASRGELSSGLAAAHQICLTDVGALTQPGTPLVIDPCTTTPSQLVTHRSNQLRIVNQCLTAGSRKQGLASTGVSLQPCAGAATQTFRSLIGSRLQNPRTGLCLAAKSASGDPGTRVWLAGCVRRATQRWRLPG
jgi:hypothetical protein